MKRSKTDPTFPRNPNFKETIDMLIALGADSNVEDSNKQTAKQMAQLKLIEALKDFESSTYDYEYFEEEFKRRW